MRKSAFCICENKGANLTTVCGCTARFESDLVGNPEARFESDLVGNPEDRFYPDAAHLTPVYRYQYNASVDIRLCKRCKIDQEPLK